MAKTKSRRNPSMKERITGAGKDISTRAKRYGNDLATSYRNGYNQGFADALKHPRVFGSNVAATAGYFKGGYDGREKARIDKTVARRRATSKGR